MSAGVDTQVPLKHGLSYSHRSTTVIEKQSLVRQEVHEIWIFKFSKSSRGFLHQEQKRDEFGAFLKNKSKSRSEILDSRIKIEVFFLRKIRRALRLCQKSMIDTEVRLKIAKSTNQ